MPRIYRTRKYRVKPTYRRKRMMRRNPRRVAQNAVYAFKRKTVLGNIQAYNVGGVGTNAAAAFSFKLTDLTQNTDFTSLFDQYKITGVKLDFIPMADNISWDVASNGATLSAPGGPLLLAIDQDDASLPALASDLLARQNCKVVPVGRRYRMFIKPKVVDLVNSTTANVRSSGWLDCDTPNAVHYGLKAWMAAPNIPNTNFAYQVWATYYIKCKGVI